MSCGIFGGFLKFVKIFLVLLACGCGKGPAPSPEKPLVLVSLAPYKFFAERIGGDAVEVRPVVPTQADPHVFEPTARQVREISRAAIWFRIGEPFEEKMVAGCENQMVVRDLRCGDELDRHSWVSPNRVLQQSEVIKQVLSEQFPEWAEDFEANWLRLRGDLEALDREMQKTLEPVQTRVLLVSHPAFGSFCQDYNIEQLSLEEEGKELRPKQLESIMQKAKSAQFALSLPQHNSKGMEVVAERLQIPVITLDPYSEDYFGMLRKLAHSLAGSS